MRIISHTTKNIYDIDFKKQGENTVKCPECSESRKKKSLKPFQWNNTKMVGYCWHCETTFAEYKPYTTEKIYVAPEWKNETTLTDKAVKWFTSRMISQKTLIKAKIYSDNEFMPQIGQKCEVICFPYIYSNKLINIKFRGSNKSFKLFKDAELIFMNLDTALTYDKIIIVEGEIDLLSLMEIGYDNVVSVPNGGGAKDMPYLDNYIELFKNKKIIIAVDNDIKGVELKNELIRRFGSENCQTVNFMDCKDSNEVLCEKGGIELRNIIEAAKDIEVSGIIDVENNYEDIYNLYVNGLSQGNTTGILELDKLITWELSRLSVWTGVPSHGKSSILDYITTILNIKYGWKVAYFSPESYPMKYHYARIFSLLTGRQFKQNALYDNDFEPVFNYIKDNYFFIYPEENFKLETILEKAAYLVKTKGINILTIDPYNTLEHTRNKGENETDYVNRVLDLLDKFKKKYNCLVNLVAHPTKIKKDITGKHELPTMYDIAGSANFYNRADYGISIYRHFDNDPRIDFNVLKVKWKHLGEGGVATFKYNYNNGRLEDYNKTIDFWNNTSYLDITQNTLINTPITPITTSVYDIQPNLEFNDIPF
jgi:twinkle protein